jgi:hypothetical protein
LGVVVSAEGDTAGLYTRHELAADTWSAPAAASATQRSITMNRREAIAGLFGLSASTQILRIPIDELGPHDVVVLECPGVVSSEYAARLQEHLQAAFPDRNKVVVLSDGMQLRVVRV